MSEVVTLNTWLPPARHGLAMVDTQSDHRFLTHEEAQMIRLRYNAALVLVDWSPPDQVYAQAMPPEPVTQSGWAERH